MGSLRKEIVIAALQRGFTVAEIADASGVTDSAVVQFISEHKLEAMATGGDKRYQSIDEKYLKIESQLLDKLEKQLNFAVLEPTKIGLLLRTINGAKRRSLSEGQATVNNTNVRLVNIKLPEHVRVKAVLSPQNEVIEIDGREIATLDVAKIDKMAQENQNARQTPKLIEVL